MIKQNKYRIRTVSRNISLESLNQFYVANRSVTFQFSNEVEKVKTYVTVLLWPWL